ncbi:MAG: hypothetical protein WDW36_002310 [Sanguina aurantia]
MPLHSFLLSSDLHQDQSTSRHPRYLQHPHWDQNAPPNHTVPQHTLPVSQPPSSTSQRPDHVYVWAEHISTHGTAGLSLPTSARNQGPCKPTVSMSRVVRESPPTALQQPQGHSCPSVGMSHQGARGHQGVTSHQGVMSHHVVMSHHPWGATGLQVGGGSSALPAAIMVSSAVATLSSGVTLGQSTGVALREWGALYPDVFAGLTAAPDRPTQATERMSRSGSRSTRRAQGSRQSSIPSAGRATRTKCYSGGVLGQSVGGGVSLDDRYASGEDSADEVPGPGQYDVGSTGPSGPSFSMRAKAAVRNAAAEDTPGGRGREAGRGPGQYEALTVTGNSGPSYTLGGRRHMAQPLTEDNPGPGHYQTAGPNSGEGPAFSMPGRVVDRLPEGPGPGEYDLSKRLKTGPSAVLVGKPRVPLLDPTPGPQDYQHPTEAMGADAPAYTFSLRLDPKPPPRAPAPGDYTLPEAWRDGPAISMSRRPRPPPAQDPTPGPGEYHQRSVGGGAPAFTFAGGRPADGWDPAAETPGPADYMGPQDTFDGPSFTMAPRAASPTRPLDQIPGPGSYHASGPAHATGPSFTIPSSRVVESRPDSPGPGEYSVSAGVGALSGTVTAPAYTIGLRPMPTGAPPEFQPGPGEYDPGPTSWGGHAAGPSFSMGARPADRSAATVLAPAPGDYLAQPVAGKGAPAYSMAGRAAAEGRGEGRESPGPGHYSMPQPSQGPSFSIATRPQPVPANEQHTAPGPGEYQPSSPGREGGPSYTMAMRSRAAVPPLSPGPGEYQRPASPGGPSFTISARQELTNTAAAGPNVGPGAYNADRPLPSAPAYTMPGRGGASVQGDGELLPGPGAYDPDPQQQQQRRGPAWSMGLRVAAPEDTSAAAPAPGQYRMPEAPAGPSYSMRGRPEQAAAEPQPGPGEYSTEAKPSAPAWTMKGRAAAVELPESPGPADYSTVPQSSAAAYSMAGRHPQRDEEGPYMPGPGAYGDPNPERLGQSGPSYTFRPRLIDPQGPQGPGPGEYPVSDSPGGPAYTMGSKDPDRSVTAAAAAAADQPGPGEYSSTLPPTGPAFSMSQRLDRTNPDESPAPGEYGIPDAGVQGPAFTLGGRLPGTQPGTFSVVAPGPGAYNTPAPDGGPAFTLGAKPRSSSSRRVKKGRAAPDPGQYHRPMGPSGPAHTIAARVGNGPSCSSSGAAPGDYTDPRDLHTGPAWTLPQRNPGPSPEVGPGPGHYIGPSGPMPRPIGPMFTSILKPHSGVEQRDARLENHMSPPPQHRCRSGRCVESGGKERKGRRPRRSPPLTFGARFGLGWTPGGRDPTLVGLGPPAPRRSHSGGDGSSGTGGRGSSSGGGGGGGTGGVAVRGMSGPQVFGRGQDAVFDAMEREAAVRDRAVTATASSLVYVGAHGAPAQTAVPGARDTFAMGGMAVELERTRPATVRGMGGSGGRAREAGGVGQPPRRQQRSISDMGPKEAAMARAAIYSSG